MLMGNHSVLLKTPGRSLSGVAHATYRSGWGQPGANQNQFMAFSKLSSTPSGYRPPYSWGLAIKDGQLSSFTIIGGAGTATGAVAGGRNGVAALAGSGDLTGAGGLIVSAVAALTGSGVIDNALAVAYLNAAADLAGAGEMTAAVDAIGDALAVLAGTGSVTVTGRATGTLDAEITLASGVELSPAAIASAVWDTPQGAFLYAVAHNRVVTDPTAGTYTVYAADDTTVAYVADLWQDADGTTPYAGSGAERRDRLQ